MPIQTTVETPLKKGATGQAEVVDPGEGDVRPFHPAEMFAMAFDPIFGPAGVVGLRALRGDPMPVPDILESPMLWGFGAGRAPAIARALKGRRIPGVIRAISPVADALARLFHKTPPGVSPVAPPIAPPITPAPLVPRAVKRLAERHAREEAERIVERQKKVPGKKRVTKRKVGELLKKGARKGVRAAARTVPLAVGTLGAIPHLLHAQELYAPELPFAMDMTPEQRAAQQDAFYDGLKRQQQIDAAVLGLIHQIQQPQLRFR